MVITPELTQRFENPQSRDGAMLEIARFLISQPGIESLEMIKLLPQIPSLNDRNPDGIGDILLRVRLANQLLPEIKSVFGDGSSGFRLELGTCNSGLAQAEELAGLLNAPYRETMAAFARAGVQTAIHLILNDERPEVKSIAKTHLIYFSLIEMLALGTKTGAYQYCFAHPQTASLEMFVDQETIRPIIQIRPGDDERKFKGSVAFGQTIIERLVVPLAGQEFYYIANDEPPPDSPPKPTQTPFQPI